MRRLAVLSLSVVLAGCATLDNFSQFGALIQPPRFEGVSDRQVELRVLPPSTSMRLGGANVRLWTRVTNPNPLGFTLTTLDGTLYLDDVEAATAEFPLGLPLEPRADATIPIELSIDFAELPNLAAVARAAAARHPIQYRFVGRVGVDAGRLGTPTFGPMTFVQGHFN